MKIFLKSLAALLFLALAVWAIRSDSAGGGSGGAAQLAEPVPAPGDPGGGTPRSGTTARPSSAPTT